MTGTRYMNVDYSFVIKIKTQKLWTSCATHHKTAYICAARRTTRVEFTYIFFFCVMSIVMSYMSTHRATSGKQ